MTSPTPTACDILLEGQGVIDRTFVLGGRLAGDSASANASTAVDLCRVLAGRLQNSRGRNAGHVCATDADCNAALGAGACRRDRGCLCTAPQWGLWNCSHRNDADRNETHAIAMRQASVYGAHKYAKYYSNTTAVVGDGLDAEVASKAVRGMSLSGPGSTAEETVGVRTALPWVLSQLGARSVIDVPVGDFGYMRSILRADATPRGIRYVGLDIVAPLVAALEAAFGSGCHGCNGRERAHEHHGHANGTTHWPASSASAPASAPSAFTAKNHHLSFHTFDLAQQHLWPADLVIVRDVLFHFEPSRVAAVLDRLGRSGCGHALITTFPDRNNQRKKFKPGYGFASFMPWNLEDAPFGLPPPLLAMGRDGSTEGRVMGLWPCAALHPRREVIGWGTGQWHFA